MDMTERNRTRQQIFESNQRLLALMNALPVGVTFSDDPTCQHVTGNPAALAQFEVDSEDNLSASAPDSSAPGRQVKFFRDGRRINRKLSRTQVDIAIKRCPLENTVAIKDLFDYPFLFAVLMDERIRQNDW